MGIQTGTPKMLFTSKVSSKTWIYIQGFFLFPASAIPAEINPMDCYRFLSTNPFLTNHTCEKACSCIMKVQRNIITPKRSTNTELLPESGLNNSFKTSKLLLFTLLSTLFSPKHFEELIPEALDTSLSKKIIAVSTASRLDLK